MKEGAFDTLGGCHIIVTKDAGLWHLSISHPYRYPTYDELKKARYDYMPDEIMAAQIFPPKKDFINVHPFCFHLWQLRDEEKP